MKRISQIFLFFLNIIMVEQVQNKLQNYYIFSLLSFGASGGKGSSAQGSSRGAMVRTVVHLKRKQELIFLVGQEGTNACEKVSLTNRK